MQSIIKIGTRESQLAVWQATTVQKHLEANGYKAELHLIKSEGDIDLKTPLYEMGVQGIFTHSLDVALLNNKIDIAVHSMKDVPTQLPQGLMQAAVLKRGNYKDLFVFNCRLKANKELDALSAAIQSDAPSAEDMAMLQTVIIGTSSTRRKAQWLHRFPGHSIENIRGNVNTRMAKLQASNWHGVIFAAAGLERVGLRPDDAIELDWMLPAPSQGAIMVAANADGDKILAACKCLNDDDTAACTNIEKDFLRTLMGGCTTPISALAIIKNGQVHFKGSILSLDGASKVEVEKTVALSESINLGTTMATELLNNGGKAIADAIRQKI